MRGLPRGVVEVDVKQHLIDPAELMFADGGFNLSGDKLEYHNIRHILADHQFVGAGMELAEMNRLMERIRREGLHHPPHCRWFNDGVQVVDGERRSRCIQKLIAIGAECWDKDSKQFVSASELYAKIPVVISEMSDEEALIFNFSASESSKNFGDAAAVVYVKHLRKCGLSDKEIKDLVGHEDSWLRQTDKLCDLDDDCFLALCQNKITRTVASELLEIENMEDRLNDLNRRIELSIDDHIDTTVGLAVKFETAKDKLEMVRGDEILVVKGISNKNVDDIKVKKEKAEKNVKLAKDKLEKHKETSPKAGTKTDVDPRPLSFTKIQKYWQEPIMNIIKNDYKDDEDCPITDINKDDLRLAKFLIEQQGKGNKDILRVLRSHKNNCEKRATE
jgi:hypothetical protein